MCGNAVTAALRPLADDLAPVPLARRGHMPRRQGMPLFAARVARSLSGSQAGRPSAASQDQTREVRAYLVVQGTVGLAKSADPPHRSIQTPCEELSARLGVGLPKPSWREQTTNLDFASGVWTFDEVVRPSVIIAGRQPPRWPLKAQSSGLSGAPARRCQA